MIVVLQISVRNYVHCVHTKRELVSTFLKFDESALKIKVVSPSLQRRTRCAFGKDYNLPRYMENSRLHLYLPTCSASLALAQSHE